MLGVTLNVVIFVCMCLYRAFLVAWILLSVVGDLFVCTKEAFATAIGMLYEL